MTKKRMFSIRTLTIIGVGIVMLLIFISFVYLFSNNMHTMLKQQETDHMQQQSRIANAVLDASVKNAQAITRDWSSWDNTYEFVEGTYPQYLENDLTSYPLLLHRFDFVVIKDLQNKTLYSNAYDFEKDEETPVDNELLDYLNLAIDSMKNQFNENVEFDIEEQLGQDGFFYFQDVCYYISVLPVLNSDETQPMNGAFIFGRIIDTDEVKRITNSEDISFVVLPANIAEIQNLHFDNVHHEAYTTTKEFISFYNIRSDYFGEPNVVLKNQKPRTIYQKGASYIRNIGFVLLVAMLVLWVAIYLLLERFVLKPLISIGNDVKAIHFKPTSIKIQTKSREFFDLSTAINEMLGKLAQTRHSLEVSNTDLRIYKQAINSASDDIIICNEDYKIEYVNLSTLKSMGYLENEMLGQPLLLFFGENFLVPTKNIRDLLSVGKSWQGDYYFKHKNGTTIIYEVSATPIMDMDGKLLRVMLIKRNKEEQKRYEDLLKFMAHNDSLTGLPNRFDFNTTLNQAIMEARTMDEKVAVLFFDLDNFKVINDSMGHHVGDRMIQETAERIKKHLGDIYTARMGDDEFTVIIKQVKDKESISSQANRIMEMLKPTFNILNREFRITASIGGCVFPDDTTDANELIKNADTAMHKAKSMGRNNFVAYSKELNDHIIKRIHMEQRIQDAVINDEFVPYFQPKVYAHNKKIFGFEALARWHSPLGVVMPNEFIPLAEENGSIVYISWMILRKACQRNQELVELGFDTTVAVNMTSQVLLHKDFFPTLQAVIRETDMDVSRLDIEITESALITDVETTNNVLQELSDMGIGISVDDFGTGYSSLSYLKKLQVDRIKIDRSFVKDIPYETDSIAIVEAVIAMSKSLGLVITSEGVETQEQFDFLREKGCDEIQGYFIKHPIPFEEVTKLLQENQELK